MYNDHKSTGFYLVTDLREQKAMKPRRFVTWILCLALLLCAAPAAQAAAVNWGESVDSVSAVLARGAVLTANTYWTDGNYRTENYIELAPGAALKPTVASRDKLCSVGALTAMAAEYEERGVHVAAGINGGFYSTTNLVPVGVVIRDGVLRCSDSGYSAIGFRADGSAVTGAPGTVLTLWKEDALLNDAMTLNVPRERYLTLFTPDACPSTMASGTGWNVYCAFDRAVPMSGTVRLTIDRVEAVSGSVPVPADRMVLSLSGDTASPAPDWIAALAPGDELRLKVSCAAGWEDVDSGICLLFQLVENGVALTGNDKSREPRSAIGVRADGGLVLYTIDGRQPGHSVGADLDTVARRMQELGCVYAGALDGGGSTNLCAVLPGEDALGQINVPSGGTDRWVPNYILLTTDARPGGGAARLALYPLDIDALSGAEIPLTVKAVDTNGYPAEAPKNVSYNVSGGLGTVTGGVFKASKAGSGVITASAPGCESVSIPVTVVESPDEISLYGEVYGHLTTALTLEPGQEVDLTARAVANHVSLSGSDACYTWSLDPAAGTVDATGHIVPANLKGSGYLTASAGSAEARIPITVDGLPFLDVPFGSLRYRAVKYVYDNGIFAGTAADIFEPDTVMNRGMLVTVLWRMEGKPEASIQPGFVDVDPAEWYGPAVAWAAETGLVAGYSADAFGPLDDLTKEQIITILHRWAGKPEGDDAAWGKHPDAGAESAWAHEALVWATGQELDLVVLEEDGKLCPRNPMPRADVAETLMRYLNR